MGERNVVRKCVQFMLWIAFRFCIFVLWTQWIIKRIKTRSSCELLSDFVSSFFEHNRASHAHTYVRVVNCFQILYLRSLNTIIMFYFIVFERLWIAFRFCIFVLWTQWARWGAHLIQCCELLSDFVSSFFEHNFSCNLSKFLVVVNCFQILYLRSLNTICNVNKKGSSCCELLSDFVSSFFEHNPIGHSSTTSKVVNCFQILYLRSLNTITQEPTLLVRLLWIAFRFCIFVLWTQSPTADVSLYSGCELLSDFVSSFFEHNIRLDSPLIAVVVNCFQILYLRSLNTMSVGVGENSYRLWIAFRFCIFVLWTQ